MKNNYKICCVCRAKFKPVKNAKHFGTRHLCLKCRKVDIVHKKIVDNALYSNNEVYQLACDVMNLVEVIRGHGNVGIDYINSAYDYSVRVTEKLDKLDK